MNTLAWCGNADGAVVDAAGLRVAALDGCLRYGEGPNQYTDRQHARRARWLRRMAGARLRADHRGADLLLTHSPPRDLGDRDDPAHRGFACYHGLIADLAPAGLLHGHVSPRDGQTATGTGRTAIRNVVDWRLLDVVPGSGQAELRGEHRHAV